MKITALIGAVALGASVFLSGCAPVGHNGYYGGYDPYSGGSYGSGGVYDPYYGASSPYGRSGSYDPYWGQDRYRSHKATHENLERKYDKAMRRLDRQEREAEEKAYRKYDGDISDPRYREAQQKIDRKYEHKREKVERSTHKEHERRHRGHDSYPGW